MGVNAALSKTRTYGQSVEPSRAVVAASVDSSAIAICEPSAEQRPVAAKANADLSKIVTDGPCVAPSLEMGPANAGSSKIATTGLTAEPSQIARQVNVALFEILIFGQCAERQPVADHPSADSLAVVTCAQCVARKSEP